MELVDCSLCEEKDVKCQCPVCRFPGASLCSVCCKAFSDPNPGADLEYYYDQDYDTDSDSDYKSDGDLRVEPKSPLEVLASTLPPNTCFYLTDERWLKKCPENKPVVSGSPKPEYNHKNHPARASFVL